jgi:hypothetical protein
MFNFRKTTSSCRHERITLDKKSGYCPDCGEYVENKWYITRCACCGVKQKTMVMRGKVAADTRFCRNCGSSSFTVEELDEIDIVNINYAVVLKQVPESKKQSIIQTWIEENTFTSMKLLPSY